MIRVFLSNRSCPYKFNSSIDFRLKTTSQVDVIAPSIGLRQRRWWHHWILFNENVSNTRRPGKWRKNCVCHWTVDKSLPGLMMTMYSIPSTWCVKNTYHLERTLIESFCMEFCHREKNLVLNDGFVTLMSLARYGVLKHGNSTDSLFRLTTKKQGSCSALLAQCGGKPPVSDGFSSKRVCNAERASPSSRHPVVPNKRLAICRLMCDQTAS